MLRTESSAFELWTCERSLREHGPLTIDKPSSLQTPLGALVFFLSTGRSADDTHEPEFELRSKQSNRSFRFKEPSIEKVGCSTRLLSCEHSGRFIWFQQWSNEHSTAFPPRLPHPSAPHDGKLCPTKRRPIALSTMEWRRGPLLSLPISR